MNDESEKSVDGLSQPSEADGDASELYTDEEYIAAARTCAASLLPGYEAEVKIDDDEQLVSRSEGGAWVRAWFFVDDYDVW